MPTEVTVRDNGPLLLSGKIDLKDAQGKSYDLEGKPSIALCRCGHSGNKPFCDGSHRGNFESECRVP